jgi:hypothetical protein
MDDFLKVYSTDNKTISVVDNSTGVLTKQLIDLSDYNPKYSYYSEKGEFTSVPNVKAMPPFTDDMVVRYELIHK